MRAASPTRSAARPGALRLRATLAGAVALVAVAPAVVPWTAQQVAGSAETSALKCGGASAALPWQETPVPAFPGVDGVTTTDRIANYSVQANSGSRQVVTNGVSVQASVTNGCRWEDTFSLQATPGPGGISAATSRITTPLLLTGGRGLLAIREGSGAASRPRVLGSPDGTGGSWAPSEAGLPAQGAPGVLVAADNGSTVYLTISPTGGTGGDDGGTTGGIPPIPPIGGGGPAPAPGLVYGSEDGGRTWAIRTAAGDLPGGDRAITALAIDRGNDQIVYAVAGGQLLRSTDGARNFTSAQVSGVRAIVTMGPGQAAAFADGFVNYSTTGFSNSTRIAVAGGITSAAYRKGDSVLAVEASGVVSLVDPRNGNVSAAPAAKRPRAGTLSGDQSGDSTFHAIANHSLIRYVDPVPPGTPPDIDRIPPGSERPPPPRPGTITPPSAQLTLDEGDSRTVDYVLKLPKSPTPLDVMYLVDVSPTMQRLIEGLRKRITDISNSLVREKIDLQAGVAFLTTGPREGDAPYPEADPFHNERDFGPYVKPEVFKLLRPIGPPDAAFVAAVNQLAPRSVPSTATVNQPPGYDAAEAQVLALDQLMYGRGVSLLESGGALAVPSGQEAGWRQDRFVRRVIVHATDQAFIGGVERTPQREGQPEWPAGSPETASGELDKDGTARRLLENRIIHLGIDPGTSGAAKKDLRQMSQVSESLAPPGGALCDPVTNDRIAEGQPLVCGEAADFGDALISVLRSLVDLQDVAIRTTTGSNAVSRISAGKLAKVNVTEDNSLAFSVTYSCADIPPGKYLTTLETRLRGSKVASTKTNLTCVKALTTKPVRPLPEALDPPPAPAVQPAQPALPPPAPPAPAAQPQVQPQVQVQVQVNPMTAAMLEQQEQLQLALALNGTERPGDDTEYAMVDRHSREERSAQIVLLASMAAASLAGVRRLRTARSDDTAVRRVS